MAQVLDLLLKIPRKLDKSSEEVLKIKEVALITSKCLIFLSRALNYQNF